jgi:hypothetical protein
MRYVLMVLSAPLLAIGLIAVGNAGYPDHRICAMVVVQLGGICLAIGMATTDIVAAIKGSRRS